jgi:UDP-3-O-[3-hydroxymyristoyl] glucosamine N-acyltransferase
MRLRELASYLGREFAGDGELIIRGVAPLEQAGAEDLSFVRSERWAKLLEESRAGACIVPLGLKTGARPVILSPHPGLDFARAVGTLLPMAKPPAGVHPTAVVDPGAGLHPEASIGAHAVVGPGCRIGARTVLYPNVTLYADVTIGEDCIVHSGVILGEGTQIADRVLLQPGVVLGGDGFGYAFDEKGQLEKVPQVGRVVLEDDVEIGANTTVDRAALGETRIRRGAKIDNLVMIAHNCDIGEGVVIVGQAGLAGSTVVEPGAMLMAQMGAGGHLRIGARAFVGARAGIHKDVPAGARVWGAPQLPERTFHRAMAALRRLPEALRRLRVVEKRLGLERGDRAGEGE